MPHETRPGRPLPPLLVEALAEDLAALDGKLDLFLSERQIADGRISTYVRYMDQADQILVRAHNFIGLLDSIEASIEESFPGTS